MAVRIKNKPSIEEKETHQLCEYYGFVDSKGHFFLITDDNVIVLMRDDFLSYNLDGEFDLIEDFLRCEFNTTLISAYKNNDFDITIDLK